MFAWTLPQNQARGKTLLMACVEVQPVVLFLEWRGTPSACTPEASCIPSVREHGQETMREAPSRGDGFAGACRAPMMSPRLLRRLFDRVDTCLLSPRDQAESSSNPCPRNNQLRLKRRGAAVSISTPSCNETRTARQERTAWPTSPKTPAHTPRTADQ